MAGTKNSTKLFSTTWFLDQWRCELVSKFGEGPTPPLSCHLLSLCFSFPIGHFSVHLDCLFCPTMKISSCFIFGQAPLLLHLNGIVLRLSWLSNNGGEISKHLKKFVANGCSRFIIQEIWIFESWIHSCDHQEHSVEVFSTTLLHGSFGKVTTNQRSKSAFIPPLCLDFLEVHGLQVQCRRCECFATMFSSLHVMQVKLPKNDDNFPSFHKQQSG